VFRDVVTRENSGQAPGGEHAATVPPDFSAPNGDSAQRGESPAEQIRTFAPA